MIETRNVQTGRPTGNGQGQSSVRVLELSFGQWVSSRFAPGAKADKQAALSQLATAVSLALQLKHTCLDLSLVPGLKQPELQVLLQELDLTSAYSCSDAVGNGAESTPLVRSENGQYVWLHKYYHFERAVARAVRARALQRDNRILSSVGAVIETLYPQADDPQRRAVEISLSHRFSVITGGPGTGKTWTIARIAALLKHHDPAMHIELAAPTGKAANRMMESLARASNNSQTLGPLAGQIEFPVNARTLHALLEIGRYSPRPRRNLQRPLDLDVLIVDEASMIDLPMMARLLDALPAEAQLILLGDRDQLSSVEAGGVLSELCDTSEASIYGSDLAPVTRLTRNYRQVGGPIVELAQSVNRGEYPESIGSDTSLRVCLTGPAAADRDPDWLDSAYQSFSPLLDAIQTGVRASQVLEQQNDFQILCALRDGRSGVNGVNRVLAQRCLHRFHHQTASDSIRLGTNSLWACGVPVMVLRNDHDRQLFNGDVGLVLPVVERDGQWLIDIEQGRLRACFADHGSAGLKNPDNDSGPAPERFAVKAISQAQMPPYENCYAMTVHKSQGSEYGRVMLILPGDAQQAMDNPVINRELLYTGITRARAELEIWSGPGVLSKTAEQRTVRMSGLRLHGDEMSS